MRKVFDEAEATGRLVEAVQSHDQPLDLAALAEQLVDLFLSREERQVADVESGRIGERIFRGLLGLDRILIAVTAALELSMEWFSDVLDCARGVYEGERIGSPDWCSRRWAGPADRPYFVQEEASSRSVM